jgi:Protein of unknown function (DUF4230)
MRRLLLFLLCLVLLACNRKKAAQQEIMSLKNMSDLATVEYVVTKIIKTNDNKDWYKIGDRKILMSCQATIKAGIDFAKIEVDDIAIDGDEVTLTLPPAKMISLNIRPEDIKVEFQEVGVLRQSFNQSEKDFLLSQGESQIRSSVEAIGVLKTAETNATVFLTQFLKQLGYKKITVRFGDHPTPTNLN